MTFFKATQNALFFAFLGLVGSATLRADEWNKKTTVTFSGPVEIPGVHLQGYGILPAGTYVFKVLDSKSDRHIVQIFSKDEQTIYATILAIPNLRLKATDKTVMTFRERPNGEPEALRAWFYPGKEWGEEFVYPKARALVLAKETNTPVLFTPAEITPEVTLAIRTPAEPVVAALEQAPVMAAQPSGQQVQIAQVVTPVPAAQFTPEPTVLLAQATPARTQAAPAAALPETASSLPLLTLFGILALAGAMSLSYIQKNTRKV